jgi:hypothetical protein
MQERAMRRIHKVLSAIKMAELAQLGANRSAAAAARYRAAALRKESRQAIAGPGTGDMAALGSWQRHAEALARDADAEATALDKAAEPMKAALARTMGREQVVTGLIERAASEARQVAERRAEG